MRARVLLTICILWILGVSLYFFTTADGKNDKYTYDNDFVLNPNGEALIVGTGKLDPYLFVINDDYSVKKIYCADDFAEDAVIWEVTYQDGSVYVLLETKANDGPREIEVFNILKLNDSLQRIASSGWFDFSQPGYVSDFTITDDMIAITQIDSNNPSVVYIYPMDTKEINVSVDADENNVRHVRTLNYTDYFESEAGSDIYFASFKDGTLMKYENISDVEPEGLFSKKAEDLYNNKVLSVSQLVYINNRLFVNCLAIMILGIATIIVLYIMLIRRNRVAYLIFIWEVMMAAVSMATIWINGRSTAVFVLAGMFFVIGSVFGVLILLLQAADLALFVSAMAKVSRGRQDIFKPKVMGGDMKGLWNSLYDLIRAIKSMNYNMFRVYEGYYHFAPKHVENRIGKNSIADVNAGDSSVLNLSLAMIHSKNPIRNTLAKTIFESISNMQEEDMGSYLCSNADVSEIEIMFPTENKSIGSSIMEIKELFNSSGVCVLAHNGEVNFSVVGDGHQNAVSIDSYIAKELFLDINVLNELRLKFVMTKDAYLHEAEKPLVRKIGWFCIGEKEEAVELYEVLDCLPEKERRHKIDTKDIFDEAMEYINTKDYYQARNIFAKILRSNPADEVSRQYLFKCEDCISIDCNKEVNFGLNR